MSLPLKPTPAKKVEEFLLAISFEANQKVPVVVTGSEAADASIKKYLVPGVFDYLVKPVDELLVRQNLKYLAAGKEEMEREVYSLKVNSPVDLIYEYEVVALGELSFTIRSKDKFEVGEFRMFSSDLFLRKLERRMNCRCVASNPVEGAEGVFTSEFWFVGVDPFFLHQLKTVMEK